MDELAAERSNSQYNAHAIWVLLGSVCIFRVVYLFLVPFDLIHDEAYYWDWSRQLDWCYYSKPPGIAWLIAAATRATASTAFFVRLPAALLSTVTAYFAYCLGHRAYDRRAGFFAAALLCATPGNAATGVMMTIDAPFLCCWSAALYCFWRMLERGKDRLLWVILTTAAVGIGLFFKQTMLAFPLLAGTFVIISEPDRDELKRITFWCCGIGALAFLTPMLFWNSQHDWITLIHTRGHFDTASTSMLHRLIQTGEFLGSQLGVLSPTTYLMLVYTAYLCIRHWHALCRRERFLIWFWLGPLLAIMILSFNQRIEANWPAPFYASALVLLAGLATRQSIIELPSWTLRRSLIVGCLSIAVTYSLPFAMTAFDLKGSSVDIAARMWGWKQLAAEIDEKLASLPRRTDTFLLVTSDRGLTAELAFYLRGQPRVFLWDENQRVDSQYDIWGLPENLTGRDAIVIGIDMRIPSKLAAAFSDVEDLGSVSVAIGQKRCRQVQLFRAKSFQGW